MTNYNERIDEILLHLTGSRGVYKTNSIMEYKRIEAKQALTSLTKELVAEAKPEDNCMDCNGVMQYEQNLLKELEEVK